MHWPRLYWHDSGFRVLRLVDDGGIKKVLTPRSVKIGVLAVFEPPVNDEVENDCPLTRKGCRVCCGVLGWGKILTPPRMLTQRESEEERVAGKDEVRWGDFDDSWQKSLTILEPLYIWACCGTGSRLEHDIYHSKVLEPRRLEITSFKLVAQHCRIQYEGVNRQMQRLAYHCGPGPWSFLLRML
ncbi:hypothetical protein B0H34DRAFT_31409 [Crassisporium funariophilum]|nr:hypothetical protein B0H34DRAFT_31409 [Crassisporium funariophilum]